MYADGSRPALPIPSAPVDHRVEIGLDWLVRLRWAAAAAQAAVIGAAAYALGRLPVARLLTLVAILLASNTALVLLRARVASPRRLCGAALVLDTLLLTGLLWQTGGPYNPFSVIYLVYITLAAVMLGPRWTRALAALSIGCFGLLFLGDPATGAAHHPESLRLHVEGMWLAFTAAALLVTYFVARLASELERRDAQVAEARMSAGRHQRLAAVTTLAASAAHELGTPLATIAVASAELERSVRTLPGSTESLAEDAALIRSEVGRCRDILSRLGANAGQMPGEAPRSVACSDIVADVVDDLPEAFRRRIRIAGANGLALTGSRMALQQIGVNLLSNAFESGEGEVALTFEPLEPGVRMVVRDQGRGMDPDELARAGEPFFSTKEPGAGMGLGLFIVKTLTEQMGGAFRIASRPGHGTTVTLDFGLSRPSGSGRA